MTRHVIEFQSKYLLRKTEIIVYIPAGGLNETIGQPDNFYQANNSEYPLLIMLSGFGSNNKAWISGSSIVDLANENKIAVALIGGENKWYMNVSPIDNWEGFLNKELPDFLYGSFRCLSAKMPLYIAGCSMGGYGALRNYLLNLDKYKACGVFSPALKPDNDLERVLRVEPLRDLIVRTSGAPKNVYLSIGDKDFIYEASMEYDRFLRELGCGFSYKVVEGYDHSFRLWRNELVCFFDYLKSLK